ncbi:hypothetical protein MBELCI_2923 [Limimaricola cinnabarinus LL-001]|uniref:Uncharacterized protein n=1 Tax=Limimaricola cinnabarinus LL-001 TaxID=1337093 RepID=U2YNK5_9RHOB|nr:hypothetical protein MBELCI_2923 [Limimaricola cinnabarinus LL-001]
MSCGWSRRRRRDCGTAGRRQSGPKMLTVFLESSFKAFDRMTAQSGLSADLRRRKLGRTLVP